MNIAQIEEAISRQVPFSLKLADGDEFFIPHQDYIALPPAGTKRTFVVVFTDDDYAAIIPLPTITSLKYKIDPGERAMVAEEP